MINRRILGLIGFLVLFVSCQSNDQGKQNEERRADSTVNERSSVPDTSTASIQQAFADRGIVTQGAGLVNEKFKSNDFRLFVQISRPLPVRPIAATGRSLVCTDRQKPLAEPALASRTSNPTSTKRMRTSVRGCGAAGRSPLRERIAGLQTPGTEKSLPCEPSCPL